MEQGISGCWQWQRLAVRVPALIAVVISTLSCSCGATKDTIAAGTPSVADFGVFSGVPTPSDRVPGSVALYLAENQQPIFSPADVSAARRVLADASGWILPSAEGEICLVRLVYPLTNSVRGIALDPIPESHCTSDAMAQGGYLVDAQSLGVSVGISAPTRVVGVVPNGVGAVKIVLRSGPSLTVPITRNAYEAIVADPKALKFYTMSAGRRVTHIVPLVTFKARTVLPTQP